MAAQTKLKYIVYVEIKETEKSEVQCVYGLKALFPSVGILPRVFGERRWMIWRHVLSGFSFVSNHS